MKPSRRDYARSDRVGDQMQRELAGLIRLEVQDPRIGLITLASVEVSRDLAYAKVFFTQMEGPARGLEAEEALNHAAGFLRHALGARLRLRSVPQLRFVYDDTPERGAHLSRLIATAIAEDEARHQAAASTATGGELEAGETDEAGKAGEVGETGEAGGAGEAGQTGEAPGSSPAPADAAADAAMAVSSGAADRPEDGAASGAAGRP